MDKSASVVQNAMSRVNGFPPIAPAKPRVLILGTMPGIESLHQQQYYAHPRNAFWKIMSVLLDFSLDDPYRRRTAALCRSGIALWDMLQSCERQGSLDTAIVKTSERLNDVDEMLKPPSSIAAIFLNGKKAGVLFHRYVQTNWRPAKPSWDIFELPSTSPANARMRFAQKLAAWEKILDYLEK